MDRFSIIAVKTSLVWMILGISMGSLMLVDHLVPGNWRGWFMPTHGHILFVGWFVQFVIGIAFWLLPRKRVPELPLGYGEHKAFVALACLNLGLGFRVIAEPFFRQGNEGAWIDVALVASSVLQVLGIVIFVTQMWPRIYGKNKLGIPPVKKT
jgi:vacuolar-type H+-ATPase subunit I/STV1